jgi:hypothetical protein
MQRFAWLIFILVIVVNVVAFVGRKCRRRHRHQVVKLNLSMGTPVEKSQVRRRRR